MRSARDPRSLYINADTPCCHAYDGLPCMSERLRLELKF